MCDLFFQEKMICKDSKNEVGCCHLTDESAGGFFVTGMVNGNVYHFMAKYCPFCGEKYQKEPSPRTEAGQKT